MTAVQREISSERLWLRPLGKSDVAALHQLWIDEQVRRFLWDGKVIPRAQTQAIVERSIHLFDERGFGIWGVHERAADQLVGFAGYWHFRTPPCLELLFGVASDHGNRGIATESALAVVGYGFETLGFEEIAASTDVANLASVRVLQKLGMSFARRAVADGLDTLFYALRNDAWRMRGATRR